MTKQIIQRESSGKKLIEQSRLRVFGIAAIFFLSFSAIAYRLIEIPLKHHSEETAQIAPVIPTDENDDSAARYTVARNDIVDRNGLILASTLATESLYANPHDVTNPDEVTKKITEAFPDLDKKEIAKRLKKDADFVWIKRNLTPKEQNIANNLGIPGLYFQSEQKRVYPHGRLLSHLIGFVGLDNSGLAGIEKYFDKQLKDTKNKEPLKLSIDLRLQHIVAEEIAQGVESFRAIGATGIVLDIKSGEVMAMANLPDFDPNYPGKSQDISRFNRASLGDYEMGSTFKTFTIAMALDYKTANLNDGYDASHPIQYAHFTIRDDHPQNRFLTIPEIYTYSSNIGTVKTVMDVGAERQQAFLRKLGLMEPVKIELPELATPRYPSEWSTLSMMTISYGHGMSVTPLHLVKAFASIVNGGTLENLTLVKDGNKNKKEAPRVISDNTSRQMRRLMRMVVEYGTGKHANVAGYRVGGKTGTAEKVSGGGYSRKANLSLFISTFPVDDPQYIVLVMMDEPKGNKATYGFTTGGWTAAPIVGDIISRMAPMYAIRPLFDVPEDSVNKYWINNANQKFIHATSY